MSGVVQDVRKLKRLLRQAWEYTWHKSGCRLTNGGDRCSCGLALLQTRIEAVLAKPLKRED